MKNKKTIILSYLIPIISLLTCIIIGVTKRNNIYMEQKNYPTMFGDITQSIWATRGILLMVLLFVILKILFSNLESSKKYIFILLLLLFNIPPLFFMHITFSLLGIHIILSLIDLCIFKKTVKH